MEASPPPATANLESASGKNRSTLSWMLGLLLAAQGMGKVADTTGYFHALGMFDFFPARMVPMAGTLWLVVELVAGAGLTSAGFDLAKRGKQLLPSAILGMLVAVAYAVITTQAYLRGLTIDNCTCFGVYLPQRLSVWVLLQDAYVLFWAFSVLKKATVFSRALR